jgi:hypothetical protein
MAIIKCLNFYFVKEIGLSISVIVVITTIIYL